VSSLCQNLRLCASTFHNQRYTIHTKENPENLHLYRVPFILFPSTAALSHRKPASTGTFCDNRRVYGHDNTGTFLKHNTQLHLERHIETPRGTSLRTYTFTVVSPAAPGLEPRRMLSQYGETKLDVWQLA
jgi:hypothetical protein